MMMTLIESQHLCRCIYRICKYYKDIQTLEQVEKRYKEQ